MSNPPQKSILVVNSGSSSIKCALYSAEYPNRRLASGKIERLDSDRSAAEGFLIQWLEEHGGLNNLAAVGHRVVHGGPNYSEPHPVTPEVLQELHRISPYDPEHLPAQIELMEILERRFPKLLQIACFDTAFHRDMPRVAKILPVPRRLEAKGVQRYGFHGLSYTFLMEELARVAGAEAARGRVILAHLGNGASLAAVRNGKGIDTSMSFTPTAGIPMSSRTGDLDPGLVLFLVHSEQMTPEQFQHMINYESGLLGVSETSSDMRDLMAREATDIRAAEAIALFCYQLKKWIGGFAAALGGLDTLVFSGGIGENDLEMRARVCAGLDFLGVQLDAAQNQSNAPVISIAGAPVTVRVMKTNEEVVIARAVCAHLKQSAQSQ